MAPAGTFPYIACWRGGSSWPIRCISPPIQRRLAATHLTICAQLFGVDVVPATGIDAPKWHEDVQVCSDAQLPYSLRRRIHADARAGLTDQPRWLAGRLLLLLPRPLQPPPRKAAGCVDGLCRRTQPRVRDSSVGHCGVKLRIS
jgi:hypothetical protein